MSSETVFTALTNQQLVYSHSTFMSTSTVYSQSSDMYMKCIHKTSTIDKPLFTNSKLRAGELFTASYQIKVELFTALMANLKLDFIRNALTHANKFAIHKKVAS